MIQSVEDPGEFYRGRGRLDHKPSPFGNISSRTATGPKVGKNASSDVKEGFYLAASHRQIKKEPPLRPQRLCGENRILDKSGLIKGQEGQRE